MHSKQHLCYIECKQYHQEKKNTQIIPLLPGALKIVYNRHSRVRILLDDRREDRMDGDGDGDDGWYLTACLFGPIFLAAPAHD